MILFAVLLFLVGGLTLDASFGFPWARAVWAFFDAPVCYYCGRRTRNGICVHCRERIIRALRIDR
jgi:hypothetical protein